MADKKYCTKCGAEMNATDRFCPMCGTDNEQSVVTNNATYQKDAGDYDVLMLIGFILMVVSTVSLGFLIIPLAWMIPLTVHSYHCMKERREMSLGAKICILIFCNLISGILFLVADSTYFKN